MPKNTIISLLTALGGGILVGFLSLTLIALLISGFYQEKTDGFMSAQSIGIVISIILCLISPAGFCLGFLLPLASIEKKRIETSSSKELLMRYLPIVTLPLGMVILRIVCFPFSDTNDRYSLLTVVLTMYASGCSSLWLFIRRLKST